MLVTGQEISIKEVPSDVVTLKPRFPTCFLTPVKSSCSIEIIIIGIIEGNIIDILTIGTVVARFRDQDTARPLCLDRKGPEGEEEYGEMIYVEDNRFGNDLVTIVEAHPA